MSTFEIEEIILAAFCVAPFLLLGVGAAYLLLTGGTNGRFEGAGE